MRIHPNDFLDEEDKDDLRPARGLITGLFWGLVVWVIISALILLIVPRCFGQTGDSPDSTIQTTGSANPGQSPDKNRWTTGDTLLQIGYATLHVIDWGQTLDIAKSPDKWRETNPILGRHPSQGKVNAYFASTLVAHTAIAYLLPKDWRNTWQIVWIGIEAGYVYKNFQAGIRF